MNTTILDQMYRINFERAESMKVKLRQLVDQCVMEGLIQGLIDADSALESGTVDEQQLTEIVADAIMLELEHWIDFADD